MHCSTGTTKCHCSQLAADHSPARQLQECVMADLSSVSISFTTAIVYLASGTFFFLLIFLLVMLGISDCHFFNRCCCRCRRKKNYGPYSQIDWDAVDLQVCRMTDPPGSIQGIPATPAPSRRNSLSSQHRVAVNKF